MEYKYEFKTKSGKEKLNLAGAYKIYALNNELPAYDDQLVDDGDFYLYSENGEIVSKDSSATFDEMIAKIIYTLFSSKEIVINKSIAEPMIAQKDARALGVYLVGEMEDELKIEAASLSNESMDNLVLCCGKGNALDMNIGTVLFDEKNELHVAFGKVRRAMYHIAENLCE